MATWTETADRRTAEWWQRLRSADQRAAARVLCLIALAPLVLAACGGGQSAGSAAGMGEGGAAGPAAGAALAAERGVPTVSGGAGSSGGSVPYDVTWDDLYDLDFETGERPPRLERLDGQFVRIPGFMVPLDDGAEEVSEFLLVPYAGACIHVPPPPPNQIVHVVMTDGETTPMRWWDPIWIYGTLRIQDVAHVYGRASFALDGLRAEAYRPDP